MNRSILVGGVCVAVATSGIVYGLHWYYRFSVPIVASTAVEALTPYVATDTVQTSDVDAIPAIEEPSFETVDVADQYLKESGEGIDVSIQGEHRFYPYQILVWHEVVNDSFGEADLMVTYAPLSGVAAVFERTVRDQTLIFHTHNRVWNGTQLFSDEETQSLWSQMLGLCVEGESVGSGLKRVPAEVMSWNTWKQLHPDGKVLSRDTGFVRDYTRDPYQSYKTGSFVWYPTSTTSTLLPMKTLVYIVTIGDARKLYVADDVKQLEHIDDTVGDVAFRLSYDKSTDRVYTESDSDRTIWLDKGYWFAFISTFPTIEIYHE